MNPILPERPVYIDIAALERRWLGITWTQLRELGELGDQVDVIGATETVRGTLVLEVGEPRPSIYCERDVPEGPHRFERVS